MYKDEDVINYCLKNVEMGILSLKEVIPLIHDECLIKLLNNQLKEYIKLSKRSLKIIENKGYKKKNINFPTKVSASFITKMNVLKNSDSKYVAKITIKGTNRGIKAINDKIDCYDMKEKEVLKIAFKLKETLEQNKDELKKFL